MLIDDCRQSNGSTQSNYNFDKSADDGKAKQSKKSHLLTNRFLIRRSLISSSIWRVKVNWLIINWMFLRCVTSALGLSFQRMICYFNQKVKIRLEIEPGKIHWKLWTIEAPTPPRLKKGFFYLLKHHEPRVSTVKIRSSRHLLASNRWLIKQASFDL